MYYHVKATHTSTSDNGTLQVVTTSQADNHPIPNATIDISYKGAPNNVLEQVTTNEVGRTEPIFLPAPPIDYSLDPSNIQQPYSQYDLQVTAEGYEPVVVSGSEILPDTQSIQPVHMRRAVDHSQGSDIVIPDHTLYGNYPPKIAEAEIKPIDDSGEIVLSRVVVPETIIVHDGAPTDSTAGDYYVPYREYIKNVASSEIYATWPQSTITANVLAIMSFTLNRVYTEWYRNKGYNFTITSSTAFDHKWIHGRNLYDNISLIVDDIFDQYLSRPNVKQPILTQYCDGKKVFCPNWMTQWGSKSLGDQNYTPIEILRYYYGDNMYINTAEQIAGVPSSWPGYNLDVGATGDKVRQMQEQINTIAGAYSAIPRLNADGVYGRRTKESVRKFQEVFGLPATGIVDFRTWYKISQIYVAVSRIAEL